MEKGLTMRGGAREQIEKPRGFRRPSWLPSRNSIPPATRQLYASVASNWMMLFSVLDGLSEDELLAFMTLELASPSPRKQIVKRLRGKYNVRRAQREAESLAPYA